MTACSLSFGLSWEGERTREPLLWEGERPREPLSLVHIVRLACTLALPDTLTPELIGQWGGGVVTPL